MKKMPFLFFSLLILATATAFNTAHAANNVKSVNDREFVQKASSGGMMEVELGQMAQEQGESRSVKDFGARMEADHALADQRLKKVAELQNVPLPRNLLPEHQSIVNRLKPLSGADFDKAYMQTMVKEHEKDIAHFKKAMRTVRQPRLSAWIGNTLPVLAAHLQLAKEVARKVGARIK